MKLLSISIQAHIAREKFFPYFKEKLGDVPFSVDDGTLGVWGNRKKALELAGESKYHLVIQDDALLCEDFLAKANEFIYQMDDLFPDEIHAFQFYHGHQPQFIRESEMVVGRERGFVKRRNLFWGVAIATPTNRIDDMIAYGNTYPSRQDDTKIKGWLRTRKIPIIWPVPCLVDHRQTHETQSLVPGNNRNRFSPYFIDRATFGIDEYQRR